MSLGRDHISGSFVATGDSDTLEIRGVSRNDSVIAQFIVQGTFVGTVNVQVNQPGKTTEWVTMENGTFTAPASRVIELGSTCDIRVDCSAYTSGTINYRVSVD